MNNRALFRTIIISMLAALFVTGALFAQSRGSGSRPSVAPPVKNINVGNAELKRFATALNDVHVIQVDFQKNFRAAMTKSPLSQKEFFKIYQSERTTHKLPTGLSTTTKRQYAVLIQHVLKIEKSARDKMIAAVKKDGFKISRFDEIVRAIHSNPTLASRLNKIRK